METKELLENMKTIINKDVKENPKLFIKEQIDNIKVYIMMYENKEMPLDSFIALTDMRIKNLYDLIDVKNYKDIEEAKETAYKIIQ